MKTRGEELRKAEVKSGGGGHLESEGGLFQAANLVPVGLNGAPR